MALTGAAGDADRPPGSPATLGEREPAAPAPPPRARPVPDGPRAAPGRGALGRAALVAVAGGLALAAAFPPAGIWPLAAAGPALLVVALWRRSLRGSFLIGLAFGIAFNAALLSWLLNVAWYAWAAVAVAEALIFGLLAVGQRLLLRLRAWPLAVAGWWVAAEALRGRLPDAFPWGRLAMSQAGAPTAGWAAVGGAPLLTFVVALAGAALAWMVLDWMALAWMAITPERHDPAGRDGKPGTVRRQPGPVRRRAVPLLAAAGAAGLAAAGALLPVDQPAAAPQATIAAVQGDVPRARTLADQLRATRVTVNHASATEGLAAQVRSGARPAPDLVLWPENSTDLDPALYLPVYATIDRAVSAIDRPVLVGSVLQRPLRNAGQLWLPRRGPVEVYVKRQLVPFGEYIPLRGLLEKFTSLPSLQPVDFTPGRKAVVFHVGKIRLGDVICYEVGFDNLVSSEVDAGANLLAVQSNDADFELDGQTGESAQQLAMARIRAVESDRAVVYVSTTGQSAIIAPDGTVVARSGIWRRAVLEARVPLRSQLTLADRAGSWPEAAITVLTIAALAWAAAGALLQARRRTPG
jgi:apolipoprotein N-acyltransferase